jgi:hypothetical protein
LFFSNLFIFSLLFVGSTVIVAYFTWSFNRSVRLSIS